jgi:hypothetical protein
MTVRFSYVAGVNTQHPGVTAHTASHRIGWGARKGWECSCPDRVDCDHILQVKAALDPGIFRLEPRNYYKGIKNAKGTP